LFGNPRHPYTERLMTSILRVDRVIEIEDGETLTPQPVLLDVPGCHFANRCPDVMPICRAHRPAAFEPAQGHTVFCHKYTEESR
jgi:peptide/nickel transport system ATP-binding protein